MKEKDGNRYNLTKKKGKKKKKKELTLATPVNQFLALVLTWQPQKEGWPNSYA
jgi:hypothetical protein